MSDFNAVIEQIKESSDKQTESNAYYLSEIYEAILNSFKPVTDLTSQIENVIQGLNNDLTLSDEKELPPAANDDVVEVLREILTKIPEDNGSLSNSFNSLSSNVSSSLDQNAERISSSFASSQSNDLNSISSNTSSNDSNKNNSEALIDRLNQNNTEQNQNSDSLQSIISDLSSRIESNAESEEIAVKLDSVNNTISQLNNENSNEAQQIIATYERVMASLAIAIESGDTERKALAVEQLNRLDSLVEQRAETAQSEENRREENKTTNKIIAGFESLSEGLSSISDGFDEMLGAAAAGVGIAGLALLFLDPETAFELLQAGIEIFTDGLNAITDLLNGSTEGLMEFIKNNPFTALLGTVFLIGKSIGLLGIVIAKTSAAFTAISGGFTAISTGFTALSGAISGLSIGLGPLIAIVAGVGLAVYSLFKAFGDALDVFGESGSFVSALKEFVSSFFANFLGTALNLVKSLISTILEFLGFEKLAAALDGFDFVEPLKVAFSAIFDVISGIASIIIAPFKLIFDIIAGIFGGIMDVVRGIASVIEGIFTGDFGQIMDGIKGIFGGLFGIITAPFEALADFVVGFIDTIVDTIKAGLKLLNPFSWFSDDEDDVQKEIDVQKQLLETKKDLTTEERAIIEEEIAQKEEEKKKLEQEKNLEYAKDSGLFEKNLIGESEVDMEKISTAKTEQLEAILAMESDDISEESRIAIEKQIAENKGLKINEMQDSNGFTFQEVNPEALSKMSTENITDILKLSSDTIDEDTRAVIQKTLDERTAETAKTTEEVSTKRGMEIPADSSAVTSIEASKVNEEILNTIEQDQSATELNTKVVESVVSEKRGMEIPGLQSLTKEDERILQIEREIADKRSQAATKEAILNKETERTNESIAVLEEKQMTQARALPDRMQQTVDFFVQEKGLNVQQASTISSAIGQVSNFDENYVNEETNQVGIAGFGPTAQTTYQKINGSPIQDSTFKEQLAFFSESLFSEDSDSAISNIESVFQSGLETNLFSTLSSIGDSIMSGNMFSDIGGFVSNAFDTIGETANSLNVGSLISDAKNTFVDYVASSTGVDENTINSVIENTLSSTPFGMVEKLSELIMGQEENQILSSSEKENEMSSMMVAIGGGSGGGSSKGPVTNNNTNVNTTNALPDQLVRDFMYKPTW